MSRISIVDLEVFYQIGITDEERSKPQRLLITVEMDHDFSAAALSDRLERTINYFDVAQELLKFGHDRSWKLLEKLTANVADFIMTRFKPDAVMVEIKKFPIPQARHVSVMLARSRN
ncbi:MAG TPA: dihydroneopterin aldolase [Verrucomicrobiae bacterium]|nr:dihydroneopterin aldolase [Verrucomicrobiae bacterium]